MTGIGGEHELIERAKAGDERAFDALYQRHQGAIVAACAKYNAPGMEFADWRQVAAIAFVSAVKNFRGGEVKFLTYMLTCVHNALATALKSARHALREVLNGAVSLDEKSDADTASIGERLRSRLPDPLETAVFEDRLRRFRKTLTPRQNELLTDLLHGYTITEIARVRSVTTQTIYNRWDSLSLQAVRFTRQQEQE